MKKKLKRFIITEKEFAKYGIDSHYDLPVVLDKNHKILEDIANTDKSSGNTASKKNRIKTHKKGISKIGGDVTGRIIEGYASTYDIDRVKDVVTQDAMRGAVDDLVKQGANTVFYDHDTNIPIGRVLETKIDDVGLFIKVMISKAEDVEKYWIKIKEKILNAFSIRLRPKKVEVIQNEETGRIEKYNILSMELFEVSVVGIPCNPHAAVTSVIEKSFKHSIRKLNQKQEGDEMKKNKKNVDTVKVKAAQTKETTKKSAPETSTTSKPVNKGVTMKQVGALIAKNNNKLLGEIKTMLKSKPAEQTETKKSAPKKQKSKSAGKVKLKTANGSLSKLQKSIDSLANAFSKRKGFTGEQAPDAGNGTPKKALKSATDIDTVKYVLFVANDEEAYKKLSEEDRSAVKALWIQIADAASGND